jgi:NADH-quinone oxidoreductase subunit J
VLAFFTSAALWIMLEAEFLGIVLVLVYVGAVMVLFLFVVMMLDINMARLREGFIRFLPVGILVAVAMATVMVLVVVRHFRVQAPAAGGRRLQQHRGPGPDPVHGVRLPVRDRGGDPAGGHHRRHRAHAAPPAGHQGHRSGQAGACFPKGRVRMVDMKSEGKS